MIATPPCHGLAGRRVFVVEDEALVSMLLEDNLAEIGCEIAATASRFDDAMEKARTLDFDIAILDVNLNGRDTFPIAETLAARGLTVVFATGYGAAAVPDSLRNAPILQKPFHRRDLEEALLAASKTA